MKLQHGDKVALIAPSSGQHKGQEILIQQAIDTLQTWGLRVVQQPLHAPARYLAASDELRAEALIQALTAPDIRAIFVTRGGYGCARLLPLLQHIDIPSPRFLVGFSDITTLHLHFSALGEKNLRCVHASNLATALFLADNPCAQQNRDSLYQFLFHNTIPELQTTPLQPSPLQTEKLDSLNQLPKTGGCLSLLVTSLGTAHEIDTKDKVLMIEEVGEAPYKIDRMLTHLKNAGKFEHVKAIVLGSLTHCDSKHIHALDVVKEILSEVACPVIYSPTFGHGDLNLPWVYG